MARRKSQAIRKPQETPEQIERRTVDDRLLEIGIDTPAERRLSLVPVTTKMENGFDQRGGAVSNGKTVKRLDEIGKLMRQHLLTARQFAAAERFQELYQNGGLNAGRAQDYGACGGGSSSVPCLIPDSMRAVAARRQLDLIRTYLAPLDEKLLIRVCVRGESIGGRVTGAERHRHVNALAWLCKALDRVASAVRL